MFKATKGKEVTMGQVSGSTEVLLFRLQLMGSMGKISAFGTFSKILCQRLRQDGIFGWLKEGFKCD